MQPGFLFLSTTDVGKTYRAIKKYARSDVTTVLGKTPINFNLQNIMMLQLLGIVANRTIRAKEDDRRIFPIRTSRRGESSRAGCVSVGRLHFPRAWLPPADSGKPLCDAPP